MLPLVDIPHRLTCNVITASYRYLVEVLASRNVLTRVQAEIERAYDDSAMSEVPKLDPNRSNSSALLRAVYAETLRLHVATLITRTVKKEHSVGSWLLQQDQNIIVSSNVEHMHPQWDVPGHPATKFYPERFLSRSETGKVEEKTFSLDGRQGQWIPCGLGEHMCPGRHFAKQEMILNAVVVLKTSEIEIMAAEGWRPSNDFERYGFGTQQPKEKVPFRVR